MLGKMETRPPGAAPRPRDGRHCDLCGCSQPAVRCDKCGCQLFCLSCDDMYHRHPKRRFHLRKAADPGPPTPGARPVLPLKAAHLTGDPSKMPLPPPRKKKPGKSFFDNFRRGSPSRESSPPLPKKEYSWTDRLGSIKKFMSNRPLPPLPSDEVQTNGQHSAEVQHNLSFIHRRVDESPPQLPQRTPRQEMGMERRDHANGQVRNGFNQNSGIQDGNMWVNNRMENQNMHQQQFATLNRNHQHPFIAPGGPSSQSHPSPGMMHPSSSATDLHAMDGMTAMPGMPPFPHYPMPPHYPYPMYPQQYPAYPGFFAGSFANLNQMPMDGDFSDHSEASTRHHPSRKHQFRKRAKRSQSVMMDRMAYPGQFFPYGPFPPGFGPWAGGTMPMEAPPSPASSVRSLSRAGRSSRRRKKGHTSGDDEFSDSSSPLSRPKSSSSDMRLDNRPSSGSKKAPLASSDEESEEEVDIQKSNKRADPKNRRDSSPMVCQSPSVGDDEGGTDDAIQQRRREHSEPTIQDKVTPDRRFPKESNTETPRWECEHCTFLNPSGKKICQVCCKTGPGGSRRGSLRSPSPPEKKQEAEREEKEEAAARKNQQDMAILNSALDEAEKEISRGLEELMKLKDDFTHPTPATSKSPQVPTSGGEENSKPVYKSSGRMRTSILDKLNLSTPGKKSTASTGTTCVATEMKACTSPELKQKKPQELRRGSNSSSASETFNSPIAQSPVDLNRKDSSCQTKKDNLVDYLQSKRAEEDLYLDRPPINRYGFGYGDRMASPGPYDRYLPAGPMQRSHSRASLFTGRINDSGPMDYGFGYPPMYRSVSRGSLTGDFSENRVPEFSNLRKPEFYLSMEELVERRRQENMRAQGLELVRMIREAEQQGFTADDIQVALHNCGTQPPLEWLRENWHASVEGVVSLATAYGRDKKENDVGQMSEQEAREALRSHKGNVWAAVTECVENRQRKFLELKARGSFGRKDIVDSLSASQGDVELAYGMLTKSSSKPFLMRIWGAGEGVQNQDGALPEELRHKLTELQGQDEYSDDENLWTADGTLTRKAEGQFAERNASSEEEMWTEDEEDVDWKEEEFPPDEEEGLFEAPKENFECEELLTRDIPSNDKHDTGYGNEEINLSSDYEDDLLFMIPESSHAKKSTSFLGKLAALKKDNKKNAVKLPKKDDDGITSENIETTESESLVGDSEQEKSYGPLNLIKNTISAIKDTVTGSGKSVKKLPCSAPEKRTIIVKGQIALNSPNTESTANLTPVQPLDECIENITEKNLEASDLKRNLDESTSLKVEDHLLLKHSNSRGNSEEDHKLRSTLKLKDDNSGVEDINPSELKRMDIKAGKLIQSSHLLEKSANKQEEFSYEKHKPVEIIDIDSELKFKTSDQQLHKTEPSNKPSIKREILKNQLNLRNKNKVQNAQNMEQIEITHVIETEEMKKETSKTIDFAHILSKKSRTKEVVEAQNENEKISALTSSASESLHDSESKIPLEETSRTKIVQMKDNLISKESTKSPDIDNQNINTNMELEIQENIKDISKELDEKMLFNKPSLKDQNGAMDLQKQKLIETDQMSDHLNNTAGTDENNPAVKAECTSDEMHVDGTEKYVSKNVNNNDNLQQMHIHLLSSSQSLETNTDSAEKKTLGQKDSSNGLSNVLPVSLNKENLSTGDEFKTKLEDSSNKISTVLFKEVNVQLNGNSNLLPLQTLNFENQTDSDTLPIINMKTEQSNQNVHQNTLQLKENYSLLEGKSELKTDLDSRKPEKFQQDNLEKQTQKEITMEEKSKDSIKEKAKDSVKEKAKDLVKEKGMQAKKDYANEIENSCAISKVQTMDNLNVNDSKITDKPRENDVKDAIHEHTSQDNELLCDPSSSGQNSFPYSENSQKTLLKLHDVELKDLSQGDICNDEKSKSNKISEVIETSGDTVSIREANTQEENSINKNTLDLKEDGKLEMERNNATETEQTNILLEKLETQKTETNVLGKSKADEIVTNASIKQLHIQQPAIASKKSTKTLSSRSKKNKIVKSEKTKEKNNIKEIDNSVNGNSVAPINVEESIGYKSVETEKATEVSTDISSTSESLKTEDKINNTSDKNRTEIRQNDIGIACPSTSNDLQDTSSELKNIHDKHEAEKEILVETSYRTELLKTEKTEFECPPDNNSRDVKQTNVEITSPSTSFNSQDTFNINVKHQAENKTDISSENSIVIDDHNASNNSDNALQKKEGEVEYFLKEVNENKLQACAVEDSTTQLDNSNLDTNKTSEKNSLELLRNETLNETEPLSNRVSTPIDLESKVTAENVSIITTKISASESELPELIENSAIGMSTDTDEQNVEAPPTTDKQDQTNRISEIMPETSNFEVFSRTELNEVIDNETEDKSVKAMQPTIHQHADHSITMPNSQSSSSDDTKSHIIETDPTDEANSDLGDESARAIEELKSEISQNSSFFDSQGNSRTSSRSNSITSPSPVDALRSKFEGLKDSNSRVTIGPIRPQSPFRRMSFNSRKQAIALERKRENPSEKPWLQKTTIESGLSTLQKKSIKQQLELERRVRQLVSDRKCRTYRKAEIAVQLMDLNFAEEESLQASRECSSLELAISYLQQECQLCAGHFHVQQIISMTHCPHKACRECVRAYFTVQIRDRTIMELLCPFCNEPDIGNEDIAMEYFNHLDIMLKKLVEPEIHELFQRKLRDRVLMRDPNFRWCSQCSSGFITEPNLKRLVCPDCNAVTCASCRRPWELEHQGISCDAFATWKDATDPEAQAAGLARLLTEDGIDCPNCHFRYALAKGGCMHFRCIQCQHDFCSGCSRPFKMGQKCGVSEFCGKLGLHAHHPRNCLFYLRDKEPNDLQRLLDMNDVEYDQDPPEGAEQNGVCPVMEQKETADGMIDDQCGKEVEEGFAGLCRIHYVEYLGQLVNKHHVDPIQIFGNDDLELVLRRANIRLPPKRYRESDEEYRDKLIKVIQEELPLNRMDGS